MTRDEIDAAICAIHKRGMNAWLGDIHPSSTEREIYVAGFNAACEACAKAVEGGRFLHDDAPDAKWAKACAAACRAMANQD